jgi:cytochrome c
MPRRFVALLLITLAAPAQANDSVRHGRALALEFCSRCHAIGAKGESPRAGTLPLRRLRQSLDLDSLPDRLMRGISATHPEMPEIRFRPQDARDMRDYLRSIQE